MERLKITEFLERAQDVPVIDVRTPAEFERGHIPGAHNVPLFDNAERHEIGTLYKQKGREPAVLRGLELVGPKMRWLVEQAMEITGAPTGAPVLVHCWRGGMRSGSVGWLLGTYGFDAVTLDGGYKAYRRWALGVFERAWRLRILGGLTGSGKTLTLFELERMGHQVIDLEGLANHRGSAFGSLGLLPQPRTEHFENMLALELAQLDPARPIWVEDESRLVGTCAIPNELWKQMKAAHVWAPMMPAELRLENLMEAYGDAGGRELEACFRAIAKRLGPQRLASSLEHLQAGRLREAAAVSLEYYDRAYKHGLDRRAPEQRTIFDVETRDPETLARLILARAGDAKDLIDPQQDEDETI